MRLDTISKMEEFITNALLSSELIPLGVNVIRLAATHDEEGIARMARSIVVRYTGSTANIQQKVPLVNFQGTSVALGRLCGLQFRISTISFTSIDEANIKSILNDTKTEEKND